MADEEAGDGHAPVITCFASLQKLPVEEQVHKALLSRHHEGSGEASKRAEDEVEEVDVRQLTRAQKQLLIQKALATQEQDNGEFMRKMRERLDRVNLRFPSVEVRFENVSVEAGVYVGTRGLPTLLNFTMNMTSSFLRSLYILPDSRRRFPILNDCSSVLKPGRLTLLLGPPGAGKSTLLKALAGQLDKDVAFSGSITYNGHSFNEFLPVRTAAYVPQADEHIGEMTVRDTFDFAARLQGPAYRAELVRELVKREAEMGVEPDPTIDAVMKAMAVEGQLTSILTDYVLHILGLDVCADTVVGNEMLRGISGGQKKRVATGEALVGPKQVLFMDEISTGLDSSTTFLITRCLQQMAHQLDTTLLVSLLQPAPETFDLFDDVLLLSEGHIVFHGPREEVLPFFESLGFKCPERKGVADFLQEVTSLKDQGQYWADVSRPHSFLPAEAFDAAFKESTVGKETQAVLATPFPKEKSPPGSLETQSLGISMGAMFKGVYDRELLLMKRNGALYIAMTIQTIIIAVVTFTVFFRTTLTISILDGNYYMGAIFFGLIMMLFGGFTELTLLTMRLNIFYKQRDTMLYPSWAWVFPMALLSIPFSLWSAALWSGLTYWTVGFAPEAGRFFAQIFIFFLLHQSAISLFRVIGSLGRSKVVSNTFGAFAMIVLFLLSGFILSKDNIHPYWIWGYWLSPLAYTQNALCVNEFLAPRWDVTSEPYVANSTIGLVILNSRGLFTTINWRWIGMLALLGFIFVFNVITVFVLQHLNAWAPPQPAVSEEQLASKLAARTGEVVEDKAGGGSSRRKSRRSGGAGSALDKFRGSSSNATASVNKRKVAAGVVGEQEEAVLAEEGAAGLNRGMVLPFTPLSLSFHNVSYWVDMPAEMKSEGMPADARLQLLRNVSGAFQPGVLTALVGVSGAGKTTLMDVLAGRKTGGYIEGDVRVGGYPKEHKTFARVAGYCEQNDIHTPQVTVHESLLYSAWLRLPADVGREVQEEFVEEVMELVELDTLRDALVGLPGESGLSTEQRKRLTIAVELVANPSIIFLDEPTSGLDARAAAVVMRTVRNTVDTGRTVVCTIHQPSIDIFESFDELLLMKRGGEVIYMGPLGTNSQIMIDYFQSIPGIEPIKKGYNPATWMLEISTPAAMEKLGTDLAQAFRESQQFSRNEQLIESLKTPPPGSSALSFPSEHATGVWFQFVVCLWKRNRMYWRCPEYNAVRLFFCTVMGLLVGGVFFGLGVERSTQQNVLNVMGALYTAALFMGWNNAASVQPIIFIERNVFYRERAAGLYSGIPYAMAQGVIELPYVLVQTLIYSAITYAMISFEWTAAKFWWYTLYMFLTLAYFTCYGMMAIAITPNEQLSMVVSSFFFSLWNLLCGFLIPLVQTPWWWRWFTYINPVFWSLYGLIESQLGNVTTLLYQPGSTEQVTVGEFVTNYLGYQYFMLGYIVLILVGFMALFFAVFAYALQKLNFQKR